jgi:K+-transporting ATPase ATPase C chain
MRRQILPAVRMLVIMSVVTGLLYALAITGVAKVITPGKSDGALVSAGGKVVGSKVIGQAWVDAKGEPLPQYFQSRPSAATTNAEAGYDPSISLGSNLGPNNPCFAPDPKVACRDDHGAKIPPIVVTRVRAYRTLNGLRSDQLVPVDAVTASGSGLDPHISIANARLQARRVATERGISAARVRTLIDRYTDQRALGILGEPGVNVLELNLALDRIAPTGSQ